MPTTEHKDAASVPVISATEEERGYLAEVRAENERRKAAENRVPLVYIQTFGCQQNVADSERLMGLCIEMGYRETDTPEDADLILINTCAVREHAEKRALSFTGQYKHLKVKSPALLIGICGCMVSQEHRVEQIKKSYPYVDFVFGTSSLYRLPELIAKKRASGKRLYYTGEEYVIPEDMPVHRESNYRAWVSVMYGCNNFCTYCIVPYVRGRERSRRREDILEEVRGLVEAGYKDITLLGQNVNSYGKDRGDGYTFPDLLEELAKIPGDYLIRFMTSHPKDASDRLIDVMAANPHIAKCFHLPMQAGSDKVLSEMNRKYNSAHYLGIVNRIREKMPDCVITSDIMVGFPGESEADFCDTLRVLEEASFDMIYSFLYSPRKGTPAAAREDQVGEEEKSARFKRLLALQNGISEEKNRQSVGKTLRVLCDGISKNNSVVYSGRTEGNKIVFFDALPSDTGRFLTVKIERAEAFALYGTAVREETENREE